MIASTSSRFNNPVFIIASFVAVAIGLAYLTSPVSHHVHPKETIHLAIIGNSMMYYNDLPRVLVAMSGGEENLKQDSCLHGGADFVTLLTYGNGMNTKFKTGQARIWNASFDDDDDNYGAVYDYGACSPRQLLLGYDERLAAEIGADDDYDEDEQNQGTYQGIDDDFNYDDVVVFDQEKEEDSSEKNPCYVNPNYYHYIQQKYRQEPPQWDYILLSDSTRSPCCTQQRETSMNVLKNVFVPMFLETGATPIFMMTYAYMASWRDMTGLVDIPTFTSYNYAGYNAYTELVAGYLPKSQHPRIAPVGLAFLLIWEENPKFWPELIHYDETHPSPKGTYLEALIVYATIYGKLPTPDIVLSEEGTFLLWKYARRMVPPSHQLKPFPSLTEAKYLYRIASRIVQGELPKSLTIFEINKSVDFTPNDELYEDLSIYGELYQEGLS